MSQRYKKSEKILEEALECIPLGSQTFSKSKTQYPRGVSPYFAKNAKGCFLWDVDDNKYIDFINGLACINIGYANDDINNAVSDQLKNGSIFTLSSKLELDVAKLLIKHIPSAEMVRFGKNGTDATSAAIRLARSISKKDEVAVCGYHGWQDWYIGTTTMNSGVPSAVSDLTHTFSYNNISSLKKVIKERDLAAVILEPMNTSYPENNFLEEVRSLTEENNIILIFDETITGFRYSMGGAQSFFNVTPDLSTFGKGMANGFPLSAIVGKKKYMKHMESIFFSGTFGGETLSLAAAKATITKLEQEDLIQKIAKNGTYLIDELNKLIEENNYQFAKVMGHPSWSFIILSDEKETTSHEIKTYLLQELFKKGILFIGSHNISASHTKDHINELLFAYREIFKKIDELIIKNKLRDNIEADIIQPLFKVR